MPHTWTDVVIGDPAAGGLKTMNAPFRAGRLGKDLFVFSGDGPERGPMSADDAYWCEQMMRRCPYSVYSPSRTIALLQGVADSVRTTGRLRVWGGVFPLETLLLSRLVVRAEEALGRELDSVVVWPGDADGKANSEPSLYEPRLDDYVASIFTGPRPDWTTRQLTHQELLDLRGFWAVVIAGDPKMVLDYDACWDDLSPQIRAAWSLHRLQFPDVDTGLTAHEQHVLSPVLDVEVDFFDWWRQIAPAPNNWARADLRALSVGPDPVVLVQGPLDLDRRAPRTSIALTEYGNEVKAGTTSRRTFDHHVGGQRLSPEQPHLRRDGERLVLVA